MKKNLVKIVAFVLMAVMVVGLSAYYSGTSVRAENAASEQDAAGKRVYFAGPLFNEAEREYNLAMAMRSSCLSVTGFWLLNWKERLRRKKHR